MDKPIRILQVGMSPFYGGTEAFIMAQYRKIDKTKVQFDFLNVYNEKIACQDEIEALGGKIYYLNMARHQGLSQYFANIKKFFEENHKNFHGIHCNMQSLDNIDLLRYAKKYKIPMRIAHGHNAGYGKEPSKVQKAIIAVNKMSVKKYATDFFACSKLAGDWMFPKGIKLQVIHNAIDAKSFRFDEGVRQAKRRELGLSEADKVLFFVGRLDPQKNPLFLIDVFKELRALCPDARLFMAGDGYMREDIENSIKTNGIENVVLLGSRKDIPQLMQASDLFVLPSVFEGLGIVLVEAQAAGLPCVASKGVIPEIVDVTGTVKFIPLEDGAEKWAQEINRIFETSGQRPDNYEKICQSGYDSAENAEKLAEKYLAKK